ncbi:nucleotidyltransferase [Limosilactobacillus fastidiosus]|uniref:tRNA(Met) cytidine acetate ligase n=1 Tax=Limosilactobacillus fastidiosus TaxID=2759855 RepID=A0A7W3YD07_9LACO|nr:nucleotidyltransferase [Limosilactobacillus fastidiosus]MBB1063696.1 nucleotidyltransferase [Limosilactobacillus fastidiosus]MBB1086775.1 nucleotidyltransferase [Limosilactobacillus fastidiosus]MCD7084271.1 nucleotidyltransferase [Limosilactobacillus fastidiosus]MCD7085498.1 nucleotidyltransferase [Limosilactobacillus fastidiosus]MCD7114729.1 nucleotidyltransferase [Limosilactobacillus fastidiosus]
MRAVGLVTEYNPFHNGHIYHIKQARKITNADAVVAVMSGNFTQRGEPTILDKWQRTQAALQNGVDLVVELPVFMAVQPAHLFAAGALELLNDLQVADIVFGAEHPLWNFANFVEAEEHFSQREFEKFNATYATQFNRQLSNLTGHSLTDPNDILAFSYYKANLEKGYSIRLHPINRLGSQYHDQTITGTIASASAIREAVSKHEAIDRVAPEQTADLLTKLKCIPAWERLYPLLRNVLIQTPLERLQQIYQMAEGLEYRYREAAERELTFAGFIQRVKTKRYTYSRLLRVCLYTVMEITNDQVLQANAHPYLHVLGFNGQGRKYLHQIKKNVHYPLLTKISQSEHDGLINLDYRAGKLYQMFTNIEQDVKHAPVIVKK